MRLGPTTKATREVIAFDRFAMAIILFCVIAVIVGG